MAIRKTCFCFASLVATAASYAAVYSDDPRDMLFHAMDRARWLSFEGIVVRRGPGGDRGKNDHGFMQIKISQKNGISKAVVLSPLPSQGVTTVDDGQTWTTFIPDENRIYLQDSPRRSSWSWRMKSVAGKNYTFTSDRIEPIAGRKALAIVAVPKAAEMPSRRYWIDLEYPLTLRMEVLKDGKPTLMMDTKAIEFVTVPDGALQINPGGDVRRIRMDGPERFKSADDARLEVGFKPAMPVTLPFGFVIQEPQIIGDRGDRFVAFRLSDGLASATVYQWSAGSKNPVPCSEKQTVREANGVKMRLVGDLPEVVLARLLESFVREALKGLQPFLGTDFEIGAFQSITVECIVKVEDFQVGQ